MATPSAMLSRTSILSGFRGLFPESSSSTPLTRTRFVTLFSSQLSTPLYSMLPLSISAIFHVNLPSLLPGLWESVLRAVPKKKTSHMKKRHRQMAGKALKDVSALNKCSACGRVKRAHLLCPYCVQGKSCVIFRMPAANLHVGRY